MEAGPLDHVVAVTVSVGVKLWSSPSVGVLAAGLVLTAVVWHAALRGTGWYPNRIRRSRLSPAVRRTFGRELHR